jgi:hypothetical protein
MCDHHNKHRKHKGSIYVCTGVILILNALGYLVASVADVVRSLWGWWRLSIVQRNSCDLNEDLGRSTTTTRGETVRKVGWNEYLGQGRLQTRLEIQLFPSQMGCECGFFWGFARTSKQNTKQQHHRWSASEDGQDGPKSRHTNPQIASTGSGISWMCPRSVWCDATAMVEGWRGYAADLVVDVTSHPTTSVSTAKCCQCTSSEWMFEVDETRLMLVVDLVILASHLLLDEEGRWKPLMEIQEGIHSKWTTLRWIQLSKVIPKKNTQNYIKLEIVLYVLSCERHRLLISVTTQIPIVA